MLRCGAAVKPLVPLEPPVAAVAPVVELVARPEVAPEVVLCPVPDPLLAELPPELEQPAIAVATTTIRTDRMLDLPGPRTLRHSD